MPASKLLIGGAAALGVRVARSLYNRWHVLPEADRRRIERQAEDLKRKALELRGASDPERARRDLRAANETLAGALVETAEANPDLSEGEVTELRSELKRELDRLAEGEVKASRTRDEGRALPGRR